MRVSSTKSPEKAQETLVPIRRDKAPPFYRDAKCVFRLQTPHVFVQDTPAASNVHYRLGGGTISVSVCDSDVMHDDRPGTYIKTRL